MYVKDVALTVEFYERAFGIARKCLYEGGQYAEMDTGATLLAFASHELARSNSTPFATELPAGQSPAMEVCFVTDDLATAYRQAIEAGAEPLCEPKVKPWGQSVCYVRDNNGFLVEICTPVG